MHSDLGSLVFWQRSALLRLTHRGKPQLDPGQVLDQLSVVFTGVTGAQASQQDGVDLKLPRQEAVKVRRGNELVRSPLVHYQLVFRRSSPRAG
jgi:hypothetical protein